MSTSTGPGSRFTRRRHRLRAGLVQLLFVAAGLVAGIFVPRITVLPLVSSGKIVDLLFSEFPLIWAETSTAARPGQLTAQRQASR